MANKDSSADAEDGAGTEAASKPGLMARLKSRKMLMIAAAALLLVLGGGGAGAWFFLFNKPDAAPAKADAAPPVPPQLAFSDVPDLLVNIQSNDGTPTYLKLSLSLEVDNDLEKTGISALMPRLVDEFQAYLRELRLDDLKGSEGVLRVKEELLRRADVAAAPYHVRDVLLKQMIVQ